MADRILINQADLDLIEQNLITYLNADGSPFKGYNFKSGPLAGIIRIAKFIIRNLSFQLNKTVQEIFLDTATLDEVIYSLIKNFNFIPGLNRPAKKYLKMKFDLKSAGLVPSSSDHFKVYWNTAQYTSSYNFIPTLRDKWQEEYYTNASASDYVDQNMFYYYMQRITTETEDYLAAIMPVYQADWTHSEWTFNSVTMSQEFELKDGSSNYYGDKVVAESIRVFVKELSGTWYEYKNIRLGLFDYDTLRAFRINYDTAKGLTIEFNIDHLSREIQDTETVRIFYAITEGDDINEVTGDNVFNNTKFNDLQIYSVDPTGTATSIFESLSNGTSISPLTAYATYFSSFLVDGEAMIMDDESTNTTHLAYFDNGVGPQDITSIKKSAPLFYVTQGRAVTEDDYNFLLDSKFVEYKDIKAWGGQREFYDMTELITDEIDSALSYDPATSIYSGTFDDVFSAVTNILLQQYSNGALTVNSVDYQSIQDGKYRSDRGFVYYSFFDDNFQFVSTSENKSEIVQYLDQYKILTMYYKYLDPVFVLLKPRVVMTINKGYTKSFNIYEMKQNIYNWFNSDIAFDRKIDLKELNSYLLSFDEVDAVDSIGFTAKLKIKTPDTVDDYAYIRAFNKFSGELNNKPIKVFNGTSLVELATISTNDGNVNITVGGSNISYTDSANIQKGIVRFQPWSDLLNYSYFYIDEISFASFKLRSIRESVLGVENVNDISLVLE